MKNFKTTLIIIIISLLTHNVSTAQITLTHEQAERVITDIENGKVAQRKVGLLYQNIETYKLIISTQDKQIKSDHALIGNLNNDLHLLNVKLNDDSLKYEKKIYRQKKTVKILFISTVILGGIVALFVVT